MQVLSNRPIAPRAWFEIDLSTSIFLLRPFFIGSGPNDDEEESTDDPSDPLDARPGLADLFSEIYTAETETLKEDLYRNVKQYVDYKLIYDFALSPSRYLKFKRPAEISRCLVFPDIQQFKRDFDRICTLVKVTIFVLSDARQTFQNPFIDS